MESNPYQAPSADLYGSSAPEMSAVPQEIIVPLQRTKFWVRLISVLLWILVIAMVILGVVTGIGATSGFGASSGRAETVGFMIGFIGVYVLIAFIYVFPAIKLWAYGSQIGRLMESRNPQDLVAALNMQRSFWKFVGIMTLISLVLTIVGVVGSAIVAATAGMNAG